MVLKYNIILQSEHSAVPVWYVTLHYDLREIPSAALFILFGCPSIAKHVSANVYVFTNSVDNDFVRKCVSVSTSRRHL